MGNDRVESLEDILLLCPPPTTDKEIVSYFAIAKKFHSGVDLVDYGDSFLAVYGKRTGKGKTPAEAIKNCLLCADLLGLD